MKKRYIKPRTRAIDIQGELMQSISLTEPRINTTATRAPDEIKTLSSNPLFEKPAAEGGGAYQEDLPWGY